MLLSFKTLIAYIYFLTSRRTTESAGEQFLWYIIWCRTLSDVWCKYSGLIIKKERSFINIRHILKNLKLVFTIFYQIFIFSPNDSPSKTVENVFLFHLKSSFCSQDIQLFVIFSLPFHTYQIQKDKWKWNNLWCHQLVYMNL